MFNLPKDQCFDAWKNKVLPKLEQYHFVKSKLRSAYRELTFNFEKTVARYEQNLQEPLREVERLNRYVDREEKNLSSLKNTN